MIFNNNSTNVLSPAYKYYSPYTPHLICSCSVPPIGLVVSNYVRLDAKPFTHEFDLIYPDEFTLIYPPISELKVYRLLTDDPDFDTVYMVLDDSTSWYNLTRNDQSRSLANKLLKIKDIDSLDITPADRVLLHELRDNVVDKYVLLYEVMALDETYIISIRDFLWRTTHEVYTRFADFIKQLPRNIDFSGLLAEYIDQNVHLILHDGAIDVYNDRLESFLDMGAVPLTQFLKNESSIITSNYEFTARTEFVRAVRSSYAPFSAEALESMFKNSFGQEGVTVNHITEICVDADIVYCDVLYKNNRVLVIR